MTFKALADDSSVVTFGPDGGGLEVANGLDRITISGEATLRADAKGREAAAKLIEILQGLINAGDVQEAPRQATKKKPNPFG